MGGHINRRLPAGAGAAERTRKNLTGGGPAMRNTSTVLGILILATLTDAPVRSQEMSAEAKAFYEKREEYKRTVRDPLRQKIEERRQALSQEADLKNINFLIEKARKAYEAVMASDPEILAAREAEKAAEKALADTVKAQLEGNTKLQAIESEIKAAGAADQQFDAEGDQLKKEIEKIREELRKSPEIQQARQAYESAQQAYYDVPNKHPRFIAARQAMEAAQRAFDERVKNLPEAKALEQAKKFYSDLRYNSPEIKQARQAREDAQQAYEKLLDHAVRSSERGAALYQRLEAVELKEAEAEAMREGLKEELYELRRSVEKEDPVIAEARKACEQAQAKHKEVLAQRTAAEQKALAGAQKDLAERLANKMKLDPILMDLMDRLKKAEKECDDLYAKYRAAREKGRSR